MSKSLRRVKAALAEEDTICNRRRNNGANGGRWVAKWIKLEDPSFGVKNVWKITLLFTFNTFQGDAPNREPSL